MFGIQGFFSTSEMDTTLDTTRLPWPLKIFIVDRAREGREKGSIKTRNVSIIWFYDKTRSNHVQEDKNEENINFNEILKIALDF